MMPKLNAAFWKWFGNSVVRNDDGSPKVMYHWTDGIEPFAAFKTSPLYGPLIFLHDDPDLFVKPKGVLLMCYVRAMRIFDIKDFDAARVVSKYIEFRGLKKEYEEFHETSGYEPDGVRSLWFEGHWGALERPESYEAIRRAGYDGFLVYEHKQPSLVVFSDSQIPQIKSIDNDGSWDSDDPNIRSNPIKTPQKDIDRCMAVEKSVTEEEMALYLECMGQVPMSTRVKSPRDCEGQDVRSGCILTAVFEQCRGSDRGKGRRLTKNYGTRVSDDPNIRSNPEEENPPKIDRLRASILHLDSLLTGKPDMARHNMSQKSDQQLMDWASGGREYYLADGGYSRIVLSHDVDEIRLTSNSRDQVKIMWNDHLEAAHAKDEVLRAVFDLMEDRQTGENPPMIDEDDENDFEDDNTGCASTVDAEALLAEQFDVRSMAANPKPKAYDVYAVLKHGTEEVSAQSLGLSERDMLGERRLIGGVSAKLGKSVAYSFWTPGLYLASGAVAGFNDLCPFASDGCRKNCLLVTGQRAQDKKTALEIIGRLRKGVDVGIQVNVALLRTYLYLFNYPDFVDLMNQAMVLHGEFAHRHGLDFAVRLNATSDIAWELPRDGHSFILDYPDVQFYDYTKDPTRAFRYATDPSWPKNYYLTFSYSEINMAWCLIMLRLGVSITVPFNLSLGEEYHKTDKAGRRHEHAILPKTIFGKNIVDGDLFDMRFFEATGYWEDLGFGPPPYVVGLRAKGNEQKAHASENSFFFDAAMAEAHGNDEAFVADQLYQNTRECIRQGKLEHLPSGEALRYLSPMELQAFEAARAGR
jgi:hypothetical protein